MNQPATIASAPPTVADLIEELGGIPARRILLRPAPGTATERDVADIHAREKRLCELIDGVLVEKAAGYYESVLASFLIQMLRNFLDRHDPGVVAGEAGMLRLAPGLVRIPDVSFVSWDRLPGRQLPHGTIPSLAPDIAIEVLSEGNTPQEMARKVKEYVAAGARLVWILDPRAGSVWIHRPSAEPRVAAADERIDGGEILPGFSFSLRDLVAAAPPRD
jgi:Uma2 family endonuclease